MENRPIQMFTNIEGYYKPVEMQVVLGRDYLKKLEMMQKVYNNWDISGFGILNLETKQKIP